jgi:hypothetical protein
MNCYAIPPDSYRKPGNHSPIPLIDVACTRRKSHEGSHRSYYREWESGALSSRARRPLGQFHPLFYGNALEARRYLGEFAESYRVPPDEVLVVKKRKRA